jgi:hypothetical protein
MKEQQEEERVIVGHGLCDEMATKSVIIQVEGSAVSLFVQPRGSTTRKEHAAFR